MWGLGKYERICLFANCILQKHFCILRPSRIFLRRIIVFYKIVLKHKYNTE